MPDVFAHRISLHNSWPRQRLAPAPG
jgi:hypothetical protein